MPLGLGGDPNDARNLWLEPNDDPSATTNTNGKDAVEETLHAAVCPGPRRAGAGPAGDRRELGDRAGCTRPDLTPDLTTLAPPSVPATGGAG